MQKHCAQLGLDLLIVDSNWQYLSNDNLNQPTTIQSTIPSTIKSTINTAQRNTTTPKQQSIVDSTSCVNTLANQPPLSPRSAANRTTSLPITSDNIQITESNYIEQIINTSKDVIDPNLFSLELDEISDCYHQSIYVFFLVSTFRFKIYE